MGHNDDDEYIFYNTYDLNQRLIETLAIRDAEDIIAWERNEYDNSNDLIKSIELDQYGEISNITEYYYFRDGPKSVYIRKSNDSNSMQEFHYTLDDKGNWINKVNINNGQPKYVYTREIKYL
ncbi:MAG: hypothetical protein IPG55_16685 [Saprospiraceae bacterium]|nr:hypothetical protein [Candidatus Defluviibacterium haderslevense]